MRRSRVESRSSTETSTKGKTPTGPAGFFSADTRRTSASDPKVRTGGTGDSRISVSPSAKKRPSASRCFFVLSFAALLGEISCQGLVVFPVLRGLLHVPQGDTTLLSRPLDGGEVDPKLLDRQSGS